MVDYKLLQHKYINNKHSLIVMNMKRIKITPGVVMLTVSLCSTLHLNFNINSQKLLYTATIYIYAIMQAWTSKTLFPPM
jgi:hypothetical protein